MAVLKLESISERKDGGHDVVVMLDRGDGPQYFGHVISDADMQEVAGEDTRSFAAQKTYEARKKAGHALPAEVAVIDAAVKIEPAKSDEAEVR